MPYYNQQKKPCPTCPYVKATPSGIWHQEEYEKLPGYDGPTELQNHKTFLCHYSDLPSEKETLCQGWLDCHGADNLLALRFAYIMKKIGPEFRNKASGVEVYASGYEAMVAGLEDIEDPSSEAALKIKRLEKRLN